MHPYVAAERGLADDVVDPRRTRRTLVCALRMLAAEHAPVPCRKHGDQPV